jgi:tRNA A-37 threonylcarbamoyl transferase component Bud32/tetratricopeptide (TPR) repeat protein
VKTIAADALEQTKSAREQWVRERCGGDEAKVAAVLQLLGFAEVLTDTVDSPPRMGRFSGTQVGPWRIHWPLGSGGNGEVYLATRTDNVRMRVAVKFLRPGVAHPGLLRRFQAEAQILAALDHPNIVRLIDAGETPAGEPYFVMEYVEGSPITTWCSDHRASLATRLNLFRDVCGAVQHAHSHLLIHRDLKPGNILVNSAGVVKLLDFGIAKLLRPELYAGVGPDVPTAVWEQPLTPDYASPEQLKGGSVSTATDIYALGVILFELLTGQVPFSHRNQPEWPDFVKSVREDRPPHPSASTSEGFAAQCGESGVSSLRRHLTGDLDNIVDKALEKAPDRRYRTPDEFSEDIVRFQSGLPVKAHPDSFGYRALKFGRRYAAALAGVAAVIVSLAVGLGVAVQQKGLADRNLAQVRVLAGSMGRTFAQVQNSCLAVLPASKAVRTAQAASAAQPRNDKLADQLAASYADLVDTLRADGQRDEARTAAQKLIDLRAAEAKLQPGNAAAQDAYANAVLRYSAIASGNFGFASSEKADEAARKPAGPRGPDVAHALIQLGDVLRISGDPKGAADAYRSGISMYEELLALDPANQQLRQALDQARAHLRE